MRLIGVCTTIGQNKQNFGVNNCEYIFFHQFKLKFCCLKRMVLLRQFSSLISCPLKFKHVFDTQNIPLSTQKISIFSLKSEKNKLENTL